MKIFFDIYFCIYIFVNTIYNNMNIKKFTNEVFGELTTITNPKTGITMFFASEVATMFGHKNITQAISRILNSEEHKTITARKYPEFFKMIAINKMLSAKTRKIIIITESALYKLAISSNLPRARSFRDWVTSEVLPSIREKGYYSIADQPQKISLHTNVLIQKQNSKDINAKNMIESGVEAIIEYNRQSCLLHTGKLPKDVKEYGKSIGLKSAERSSAKQVLRKINPPLAAAMSFTDNLTKNGFDLKTVSELSLRAALPLFEGMKEIGIDVSKLEE